MTAPATNPLSYNAYIQNVGVMAVARARRRRIEMIVVASNSTFG
jgi:hypothetical protein